MKTRTINIFADHLVYLTIFSVLFFAGSIPADAASDSYLSPQTRRELAIARQATARYRNIENAIADGYVLTPFCFANMGCHYAKPETSDGGFDAEFDPARPELLVYSDFGNGRQRLVAVEYAVPLDLSADAPEGFTGCHDVWHKNEAVGLWTLHAWIWYSNPDGIFEAYNPRVP